MKGKAYCRPCATGRHDLCWGTADPAFTIDEEDVFTRTCQCPCDGGHDHDLALAA